MRSKGKELEAKFNEAKKWVTLIDEETDENSSGKLPHWLKLTNELKFYFDWKTVHWDKDTGWWWNTERIFVDE